MKKGEIYTFTTLYVYTYFNSTVRATATPTIIDLPISTSLRSHAESQTTQEEQYIKYDIIKNAELAFSSISVHPQDNFVPFLQ